MINEKRNVRNYPLRFHLPMYRCLTFLRCPHIAQYPKHVTKLRNSFELTNTLPTFSTIFPPSGTIKKETPYQQVMMRCFPQKFAKNLLKTKQTLPYMRAAALEPPARANMRALNTSYMTFHQLIFFIAMPNHKPFQSLQAGEFDQLQREP